MIEKIKSQCGEAEPIYDLKNKFAYGTGSPAWKKRALNNQTLKKKKMTPIKDDDVENKLNVSSSSDDGSEKIPGDDNQSDVET